MDLQDVQRNDLRCAGAAHQGGKVGLGTPAVPVHKLLDVGAGLPQEVAGGAVFFFTCYATLGNINLPALYGRWLLP